MPEKRFLFQPHLTQVVGSNHVRKRVDSLTPDLHVFGHSHFPWDMILEDGVRYVSWPLGMPDEQSRRISSNPIKSTAEWHPVPVFDSLGRHYPTHESCWFSWMYSRIPREPSSPIMADYVKAKFAPDDTLSVPPTIISPGWFLKPSSNADELRREQASGLANSSMSRQVGRPSAMQAAPAKKT
mmetsp:Transcript_49906/g.91682  ORF Transcript_49906/g.91682 Transcript_49906/m.91682 type:complete len:183 (+) Transcript_49906:2-550(+)